MITVEVHEDTVVRLAGASHGDALVFLHAFGDSGYCYADMFASSSLGQYRLIAFDLWGFGTSPRRPDVRTVEDYALALEDLILATCPNRKVGLVGHSIAASIAVRIANRLGNRIAGVFSIEGNLTPDDAMFTGRAAEFDDPIAFKRRFLDDIWRMGQDSDELRHYYSGARLGDAHSMWHLGRDAKRISPDNALGEAFRGLSRPKLYYWSKTSTPASTAEWIERTEIPNRVYSGAGHWPMVTQPERTAMAVAEFFADKFP